MDRRDVLRRLNAGDHDCLPRRGGRHFPFVAFLQGDDRLGATKVTVQMLPQIGFAEQPLIQLNQVGVDRIDEIYQSLVARVQNLLQVRDKPRLKTLNRRAADEVSVNLTSEIM